MNMTLTLLPAVVLAGAQAVAQGPFISYEPPALKEPTFTFKTVLRPDTSIAGHVFINDTIGNAIIGDSGDVVFTDHWKHPGDEHTAVFTLNRIVAMDDAAITIPLNGQLSIDAEGSVAYEAVSSSGNHLLAVERHISLTRIANADGTACRERVCEALCAFRRNGSGQFVLVVNTDKGPYLIEATPR